NPNGAINVCKNAPIGELRTGCLVGAVQDSFWDPTGQDAALAFCKILTEREEKDSCYNTIFGRSTQVLASAQEHNAFCQKAEASYQQTCLQPSPFINE
ncbi:MAG: hypothetical protein Q7R44_00900, partial [bacterium]|nr:hypothetical protein [bacterium]